MILYHGSNVEIVEIDLQKSRPNKDFGQGFYLSADRDQAFRMAQFKTKIEGGNPFVTEYEFDNSLLTSGELKVKNFDAYTEEWAQFIFMNRKSGMALILKLIIICFSVLSFHTKDFQTFLSHNVGFP